jgi:hypothetical protein
MKALIPSEIIENKILLIRGQKVLLDKDLSILYEVTTKVLIQAVKRNINRFPDDFMFQVNKEEFLNLRSQFVTSSWGGRRYLPYVFTEQGIAMLSTVLNSERAIQVNIVIMRVFVKLRQIIATHKDLIRKLDELEQKTVKHDTEIKVIFDTIRQLMAPPEEKPKPRIGFHNK